MNYSTFVAPSYVPDVFPTFSDLPASLLADAQTYQTLKLTTNLTTAQQTQLASLTTELQNYIISTSTFNAFSQAVMNMEQLILYILNFKDMGAWVSTTTYAQFNICEYNNQTFMSKQNTNLNNIPVGGGSDLYWTLIAKKGVSFRPLGTWSSSTAYINDVNYIDVVYSNGSSFYCIQSNTNQQPSQAYPPVNTAYWGVFSMGGAVGATGAQGLPGAGLVYKQVYNTATSYSVNDLVSFNNSLYYCTNATTGNIDPTNLSYWALFLSGTGIPISSSAPLSPAMNQLWISSTTKLISYWNGTSWIPVTSSALTDGTLTFTPSDIANISVESTGYGIISGLTVTQSATPNMTVNVATGIVHMANGMRYTPTANLTLAISTADATNPRIDIVYVSSTGIISYLAGTPAATPTVPSTPSGGFLLAQISVSANATTVVNANITDKRKIKNTTDSNANQIGDLSTLTTINKTSLVGAVNEVENTQAAHLADNVKHITSTERTTWNGKLGFLSALASNADFNTITTMGTYLVGSSASMTNKPQSADYSLLEVYTTTNGYIVQKLTTVIDNITFYRTYTGSSWSNWKKVIKDDGSGNVTFTGLVKAGGSYNLLQALSGGYKIQSGTVITSATNGTAVNAQVTFPVAFSSAPVVFLTPVNSVNTSQIGESTPANSYDPFSVYGASTTGFTIVSNQSGAFTYAWVAIGS